MPFGAQRDNSGPNPNVTHYRFTDQELDVESGLYNYNARLYDPVIGRFISADTIVLDPHDPQDLNRYTYCRNNPLVYVDPSGHHYGTAEPGGKADFGGETVSGRSLDNSDGDSGPYNDPFNGWSNFYNSSKSYFADPVGTGYKAVYGNTSGSIKYAGGGRRNAFQGDKGYQIPDYGDILKGPGVPEAYQQVDLTKGFHFSRAFHPKCDYATGLNDPLKDLNCYYIKSIKQRSGSTTTDWVPSW